jgi:hypothetical protein
MGRAVDGSSSVQPQPLQPFPFTQAPENPDAVKHQPAGAGKANSSRGTKQQEHVEPHAESLERPGRKGKLQPSAFDLQAAPTNTETRDSDKAAKGDRAKGGVSNKTQKGDRGQGTAETSEAYAKWKAEKDAEEALARQRRQVLSLLLSFLALLVQKYEY